MMHKLWSKVKHVMTQSDSLRSSSAVNVDEALKMDNAILRLNQAPRICLFRTDYLE
ncbi:hypothetical protein [Acinetobacter shaoyimingii]|uniref:Uncharacterized protein n=1 Tax=Acinetobacter shaoyimingii TaxID=2715164 RepID=A0A6G8RXW0_9GAMM|nr:hypothetical protein [Acinetobacter shaoyimingii]NHB57587.1 hypothetical protein [Acinetobacter shaoyimingii]QIO06705.1 hypothetical protein G8E00_12515 [Acinetobacter shaoyimingii]